MSTAGVRLQRARRPGAGRSTAWRSTDPVRRAIAVALRPSPRVVLAVSGGRDSMVMLHAAAHAARANVAVVATYDHGTGSAASAAADLAAQRAEELGFAVSRGRATDVEGRPTASAEARWRDARWRFLRDVAWQHDARVATAHTEDDQLETVFIRVLRGSGARGLAGLYATGPVLRPLLGLPRAVVATYAREWGVDWMEDPSNRSRRHLRNRVRLDLLPALIGVDAELGAALLRLARSASSWRADVDAFIGRQVPNSIDRGTLRVARSALAPYDTRALSILWPALAARVGVTLDRRGTSRLATFTIEGATGRRVQLSGGYEVVRHRDALLLRRATEGSLGAEAGDAVPLTDGLVIGRWRFGRTAAGAETIWTAALPETARVRLWRPGDRMMPAGSTQRRRLKGLLRDAGIDAAARVGWPVVLDGDEIVWVPGVRRSSAATERSGRPAGRYVCDRLP